MLLIPVLAMAQGAQAGTGLAASLTVMKKNVAKITEADEKARWQANVDLWQAVVSGKAIPKGTFATMKANVGKIREVGEKSRWKANLDLWQLAIGKNPQREKAMIPFGKMKGIVSKIEAGAERERWSANVKMWQTTIEGLGRTRPR